MSAEDATIPYRVGQLEVSRDRQRNWIQRVDEGHGDQAVTIARHEERLDALETAVEKLAGSVTKGVWALVGFSFTVAASAVGLAITLGGPPT
jgi:hypothetical protein